MQEKQRRTIGVFINRFDNAFQQELCRYLHRLSQDAGFDMLVFNTFGNKQSENTYEDLEKRLIDLAPIERLDGIVLTPDTYVEVHRDYLLAQVKLRARRDCPVVTVRSPAEGITGVLVDEEHAIEGVIRHILDKHDCQRIAFLGGEKGEKDAIMRLDCFERVMAEYGLTIPGNAIYHGNFWRTCAKRAADFFFVGENAYHPDAIICANDYMALALLSELLGRGLRVPEDVIVTGYDNVPDSATFSPSLTTVDTDYQHMAKIAFSLIEKALEGQPLPKEVTVPAIVIPRESCGCARGGGGDRQKKAIYEQFYQLSNTQVWQLYFNINVSGCEDLEVILRNVVGNIDTIAGYRDFALCLCLEDGKDIAQRTYADCVKDKYEVALAVRDRVRLEPAENDPRFILDGAWPLPELIRGDKPKSYYFCALHDRSQFFGYSVISFEDDSLYAPDYQNLMVSIGGAFSNLCNRKRLEYALEQNRRMSVTDPLTGLLNRRGFELFSGKQCACAGAKKSLVIMLCFDLDGLKRINDQFGHAEGDYALQAIADAIRDSLDENGIASRSGGDEFVAMFLGDEGMGQPAVERFHQAESRINERANKPYRISASVGVIETKLTDDFSLEDCMRHCDQMLYEAKAKLRRRRSDDR